LIGSLELNFTVRFERIVTPLLQAGVALATHARILCLLTFGEQVNATRSLENNLN